MKTSRKNAEHYKWGADCDGWHLVKQDDLSVIHEQMPPGTCEVRHVHRRARQYFFVLSGVATLEVNGERIRIEPHEGVEVAPGVAHQLCNETDAPLEFLVISQPTTRSDRFPAE